VGQGALATEAESKSKPETRRSRWEHGRKRDFAVDCLFEDVLDCRADFRSVAIDDPALLAFLKGPARHHLKQHAPCGGWIVEHFGTDRFRLTVSKLNLSSILGFCIGAKSKSCKN